MEKPIIKVHALIALLIFTVIQINVNYIKSKNPFHYFLILAEVMKMKTVGDHLAPLFLMS